jgi:predicted NBD/HSP70 family sugar kinase
MSHGRDEIGQRSETVRRANLGAIVRELYARGPLSRSELVRRTGLTRSAIRVLTGQLAAAGLVTEGQAPPLGSPGRPSHLVRLVPGGAVVLALEIAVDSSAAAVVGLDGDVEGWVRRERTVSDDPAERAAGLAALAARALGDRSMDEVVGIAVAVPGVVRRRDGLVSMAPNLGWRDVPFGEMTARALGATVPVAVANEADLAVLAELHRGAARGEADVVLVSGAIGVGGGLVAGGRPLLGAAGYGGELGHMPVRPSGSSCRCGSIGCWETEVGLEAILARGGREPGGGLVALDGMLRDAAAGAPAALAALDETGAWLGIGLAGLVNLLNPRLVVLGGVFETIFPLVAERIDAELDRRVLPAPRALVRVVPAKLGADAPLRGAAELAFEPLLEDPARWFARDRVAPERRSA